MNEASGVLLSPAETAELGMALHRAGRLHEAEWLYRRLLQAAPENADGLHFLGVLCHQVGRSEEAQVLLRRCLGVAPGHADAWSNLGNVLQELGRPAEAEAAYREALGLRPDHAAAWNNLGIVLSAQERGAEALEAHRRAAELAPDAPDYWYNLGNALRHGGDPEGAEAAHRRALALAPAHTQARQSLARLLLVGGRAAEAADVYREWLRLEPGNPLAAHMLAAATGEEAPGQATQEYVRLLFDGLSSSFDAHLESLGYQAPRLVADALARELPEARDDLDVLDAGCGTGLCGPLLRPYARRLTGVDLSAGMLQKASTRGGYDELAETELTAYLQARGESFDVVASADTLCYLGDLGPPVGAAARALRAGGLLVFTVEALAEDAPRGFRLNAHGRYSHTRSHLEAVVARAGLELRRCEAVTLRREAGESVNGWVVVARRGV